jgi:hypothetical protein
VLAPCRLVPKVQLVWRAWGLSRQPWDYAIMMTKSSISIAALVVAMALNAPAHATTYFSGSLTANAPTGMSQIISFSAPGGTDVDVTVTDCCIGGDYYAAYVDGAYIGTTPFEPEYGSTLSSATFLTTLGVGPSHEFYVVDQTDFLLPAGLSATISAVPEPATWSLMLMGVFGLGAGLRARRREARLA